MINLKIVLHLNDMRLIKETVQGDTEELQKPPVDLFPAGGLLF